METTTLITLLAILLILLNFVLYPLVLIISAWLTRSKMKAQLNLEEMPKSVSFIVVAHNAENLIEEKINNILTLNLHQIDYEIIVYLDGCTDKTLELINQFDSDKIILINENQHLGKAKGLNEAANKSKNEILVFTDMDAILDQDAILYLLENFKNSRCGGVCGLRTIRKNNKLQAAQSFYVKFDSYIKQLENNSGNITSNDGKLYAIRKKLFKPIASDSTDDLYNCLNITEQRFQFIFDGRAKAYVPIPSKNTIHELSRRRRIVVRSLSGIYKKRTLLNPFEYGTFAIGLFINKVLRRTLGISMLLLLGASFFSLPLLFYAQLLFYLGAVSYPLIFSKIGSDVFLVKFLIKVTSTSWYFCAGNYATSLAVIDFISGKRVDKWTPQKQL